MEPIQSVLTQTGAGTVGNEIKVVWNALLGFTNTIMVIALLAIAFANILHIQLDKYAIKKILPSLIVAIVLANFSYFICRFFIDIANMLLSLVLTIGNGSHTEVSSKLLFPDTTIPPPDTGSSGTFWPLAWTALFQNLGSIVGSVFIAILAYLFFIRNWVIYFLVALSPLAFIGLALPQTQTLFQTWWKQFLQWVFMPVVSGFWLWVGAQFLIALGGGVGGTMIFVFAMACFYMAFTTPFKMGGAIMKGWGGLGKRIAAPIAAAPVVAGRAAWNRWGAPEVGKLGNRIRHWYGKKVLGDVARYEEDGIDAATGYRYKKGEAVKDFNRKMRRAKHNKETGALERINGQVQWEDMIDDETGQVMYEDKRTRKGTVAGVVGWHYDRARASKIDRDDAAFMWESIQDQMQGNSMNYWTLNKQRKRQKFLDEANSYKGEIERTELHQRTDFLENTAEGKQAQLRTKFYNVHMTTMKQHLANMDKQLEAEIVKDGEGVLFEEGSPLFSGNGKWRRSYVKSTYDEIRSGQEPLMAAVNKITGDDLKSQYHTSGMVNALVDVLKESVRYEKELTKLAKEGKIEETYRASEMERVEIARTRDMTSLQRLVTNSLGEYGKKGENRIAPLAKKLLGGVVNTTADGQLVLGEDGMVQMNEDRLGELRTIGETQGFTYGSPEDAMITDRSLKVIQKDHLGERASESEKRTPPATIDLYGEKPEVQRAYLQWRAGVPFEANTHNFWDARGYAGNGFSGAGRRENAPVTEKWCVEFEDTMSKKMLPVTITADMTAAEKAKHIQDNEFRRGAAQAIIDDYDGVASGMATQYARSPIGASLLKDSYNKHQTTLQIAGTAHAVDSEESFQKAMAAAIAARDDVAKGALGGVRTQVQQEFRKELMKNLSFDESLMADAADFDVTFDENGTFSGAALTSKGDYANDLEARKKVETFRQHWLIPAINGGSRQPHNIAFLANFNEKLDPFSTQINSDIKKELGKRKSDYRPH
jgi:hypothetical protein